MLKQSGAKTVPHRPNTRGTDARQPNDYKDKGEIEQASLHGFGLLTIQADLCSSLNMRDRGRGPCRRVAKMMWESYQRTLGR